MTHTIRIHPRQRMRKYHLDFAGSEARALLNADGLGQWKALRVAALQEIVEVFEALGREARGTNIPKSVMKTPLRGG